MKIFYRLVLVLALFIVVNSCKKADTSTPVDPNVALRANAMADYDNLYLPTNVNVTSGTWNGNTSGCNAGSLSSSLLSQVLTRLNYFRKEVGLAPVGSFNPTLNDECQQAALMEMSNSASGLNHVPPTTWTCYSEAGAQAARSGNLAYNSAQLWTYSIDEWIGDNGTPELGHRRWILNSAPAAAMGYGSTGTYASLYCDSFGTPPANLPAFVAWPGQGYIPVQFIPSEWSFSIPSSINNKGIVTAQNADFSKTTVSMTDNNNAAVQISNPGELPLDYADNTFGWYPQGLISISSTSDYTYHVTIKNVIVGGKTMNYSYTVTFFLAQ